MTAPWIHKTPSLFKEQPNTTGNHAPNHCRSINRSRNRSFNLFRKQTMKTKEAILAKHHGELIDAIIYEAESAETWVIKSLRAMDEYANQQLNNLELIAHKQHSELTKRIEELEKENEELRVTIEKLTPDILNKASEIINDAYKGLYES